VAGEQVASGRWQSAIHHSPFTIHHWERIVMAKAATGKWPRVQLEITCRTCNDTFKFSIYYGRSTV
jgi:hypothetical protein